MKISVIVCTYNRCQSLAKALESVAQSQLPDNVPWEVLVVDNNSKDDTRGVVDHISRRYPGRFRYAFEQRQGKSFALNAGIELVEGDITAFLDDDVVVEPSWLDRLTHALFTGKYAGSGGKIVPQFNSPPPKWLPQKAPHLLGPLPAFDLGADAGPLTTAPFGTNMAYRKNMFRKYGGFQTNLGPQPGCEIRNEDTEFGHRLLTAGEKLFYEPAAVVYHPVVEGRLQQGYFLRWWYDKGRADIRQAGADRSLKLVSTQIPLLLLRRLFHWTVRWTVAFEPADRFSKKLLVWYLAGEIAECRHRKPPGVPPPEKT